MLLDAIGWTRTSQPVSVPLAPPEVHLPLVKALDTALMFAQDNICEAVGSNSERAGQGEAAEDDQARERLAVLRGFAETVADQLDSPGTGYPRDAAR